MRNRSIIIIIMAALLLLNIFPFADASAATISLDGVANSGWWADDLTSSYFYVKNLGTDSYYYQWRYGDPDALRWGNLDAAIADLNTQGFSWWLESGGDPFNSPSSPIWTSIYLEKGLYEINLASDSSAYNLSSYWGGNDWNAYVQIWAGYDDSFNFGEGSYISGTATDALNFYRTNVDGMRFDLKENTNLYFYINDSNSVDNAGSVKLDVTVVPEPGPVLLFITGAFTLLAIRYKHKVMLLLK